MEIWFVIGIIAAVLLVVAVVLVVLRTRSEQQVAEEVDSDLDDFDASVEYEWTAGAPGVAKILLVVGVVLFYGGIILLDVFTGEDIFGDSGLWQIGLVSLGALFSALGPLLNKKTYRLTHDGLYMIPNKKKGEYKNLFHWNQLLWFKPGMHGFRYYLKSNIASSAEGEFQFLTRSRRVHCGKHAMLVNSMIMARGIPASPPSKAEDS